MTLHARVAGNAAAATEVLVRTLHDVDPRVPVDSAGLLQDHINARLSNERVLNVLSILFACLAALVGIGVCLGMPLSIAVGRQFGSLLYGLDSSNVLMLVVAAGLLTILSIVAAGVPAARASGLDPSVILRDQ